MGVGSQRRWAPEGNYCSLCTQGTTLAIVGVLYGHSLENEFRPRGRIASVTRRNSGVSPAPLTPGVRR
jgi:hypothetical protein